MGDWNIAAPFLSEEEAAQAVSAGGLSGGADPGDTARGILLGLQRRHVYGGTVAHADIEARRKRNKNARKARRITRRSS